MEVTQLDAGGSDVEWVQVEAVWEEVAFDKAKLL